MPRMLEGMVAQLPNWLAPIIALARPAAVTMLIMIPAVGSFTVGAIAFRWPTEAAAMANVSVTFLKGIPDAVYGMITAVSLGYAAAKTTEFVKTTPPADNPPATGAPAAVAAPAPPGTPVLE